MAKKDKDHARPAARTSELGSRVEARASTLSHNPFAALATRPAAAPPPNLGPAPVPTAQPPPQAARAKSLGRVVLRRETKHRGGKAVVVIAGLGALENFDARATAELAQQLKQQLGCGGTVEQRGQEREIVLQGDRAAKVAELLRARGFRVDGVTS
jgi:translation initiation factor 1 (eIF-1/SUI1)